MPVQRLLETVLIQMMTNESNGSAQNKESIEASKIHQFADLFTRKCSTRTK